MGWQQKKEQRLAKRQESVSWRRDSVEMLAPKPGRSRLRPGSKEALLAEARTLIGKREYRDAHLILGELAECYPNDLQVLDLQCNLAEATGDLIELSDRLERLAAINHKDPLPHVRLLEAYFKLHFPLLSLRELRLIAERWPMMLTDLLNQLRLFEAGAERVLEDLGFSGHNAFEHGCLNEQVLLYTARNDFVAVRRAAEKLIQVRPTFVPARNNLAQAAAQLGDYNAAVDALQQALALDPENVYSTACLIQVLVFQGRLDEAWIEAGNLKQLTPRNIDARLKTLEALHVLGDDEGVLTHAAEIERMKAEASPRAVAIADHYAGVAHCRLGKVKEAKRLWRRAIKSHPDAQLVQANLDDLELPASLRHGGWVHSVSYWLPQTAREDLRRLTKADPSDRSAVEFLLAHPEIEARLPILLDRGDPGSRSFALIAARAARTRGALMALRDFALGQRGPDEMRKQAAMTANEEGCLPSGPVSMWQDGEWKRLMLLSFHINHEAKNEYPTELQDLAYKANQLLNERKGKDAEELLRQLLVHQPNCPTFLNNLVLALNLQGRYREGAALAYEIHERFPDYFFSKCTMAFKAVDEGRLDDAKKALEDLSSRKEYHPTEFSFLTRLQVAYCLARNEPEMARMWIEMLERAIPDDPRLPSLKEEVGL